MEPLISAKNIKKYFNVKGGVLKAVDDVSFDIYPGETFGLVGESGCGKSTMGRTMIRLYEPTDGEMYFEGENIYELSPTELRKARKNFQIIFQDPYASLNPRMTVEEIVAEPMEIFKEYTNEKEKRERVTYLLNLVGLSEEHASRFPHEFSGGQRRSRSSSQFGLRPKFIVCDGYLCLNVSIQAQVMNLLERLQEEPI